jgi:hypothetical protein
MAIGALPTAGLPSPGATTRVRSEVDFPTGSPADPATADAVAVVVREFAACLNAGDLFRSMALVTDDFLCQSLARAGTVTLDEALAAAATPPVPLADDERVRIVAVRDARVLADGRVGVVFVQGGLRTSLIVLKEVGGRWLVDGIIEVDVRAARQGFGPAQM